MISVKRIVRNALILAFYLSGLAHLRRASLKRRHGMLSRVICFHWIGPEGAAVFERQLVRLKKTHEIVWLSDLVANDNRPQSGSHVVAITFDDGYADLVDVVLPILERHSIPITLFLPSDVLTLNDDGRRSFGRTNIGIDRPMLSGAQIRQLLKSGLVDIQSHTMSHCDCGIASFDVLMRELGASRRALEEATGASVTLFAYPYGSLVNTSEAAREALIACGYAAAWTIIPGFNRCDSDRYMLNRDSLSPDMNALLFRAWLAGAYDVFKDIQNRRKNARSGQAQPSPQS